MALCLPVAKGATCLHFSSNYSDSYTFRSSSAIGNLRKQARNVPAAPDSSISPPTSSSNSLSRRSLLFMALCLPVAKGATCLKFSSNHSDSYRFRPSSGIGNLHKQARNVPTVPDLYISPTTSSSSRHSLSRRSLLSVAMRLPDANGASCFHFLSNCSDSCPLRPSSVICNLHFVLVSSDSHENIFSSPSSFQAGLSSRISAFKLFGHPEWRQIQPKAASDKKIDHLEVTGSGGDDNGAGGGRGGSGGEGGGHEEGASDKNRIEALLALASLGRSLENIPADLAYAIQDGRVTAAIVERFVELEKAPIIGWLLRFGGFKERLLADDLFLTKVAIECGVGIFTKTAAELERRREKFMKELDFVVADVVMALIADFMLVWLPAPTVSLRPPLAKEAGKIAKFFYNCPDNAFQVAIRGQSYTIFQRVGAILRNGTKLFVVGTGASLVGTAVTNALIKVRRSLDKNFAGEAEDVPILSTSVAYGVYMAVSSNLRYQILAGVIEQRILEPLFHNKKLVLSVVCFVVRTGNTFLGSLMWVDYARWVGVQKIRE